MSTAIKVENLSKAYRIGQIGTGTISQDIERWWITKVMRREDPFLKLGETNDRTRRGESNVVWSLKDINFEVEQGEAVGIIGRNGAGKSTLLKILSRVTAPTTGSVKIKGRVASLLEVGTGFHPELTGRENIYLNGSILGMRKREIDRKLDEIIDFSGVERYIDTPVKRYSSGMSVRLAFAVAAHLESEILIVDEVLAVGDAEFQKRCLGKIEEVGKKEGRTILFVSHNMNSVSKLCSSGMVFQDGTLTVQGRIHACVESYLNKDELGIARIDFPIDGSKIGQFTFIEATGKASQSNRIRQDDPIVIAGAVVFNQEVPPCLIMVSIWSAEGFAVYSTTDWDVNPAKRFERRRKGFSPFSVTIPEKLLFPGRYFVRLGLGISGGHKYDQHASTVEFEISHDGSIMALLGDVRAGIFTFDLPWQEGRSAQYLR